MHLGNFQFATVNKGSLKNWKSSWNLDWLQFFFLENISNSLFIFFSETLTTNVTDVWLFMRNMSTFCNTKKVSNPKWMKINNEPYFHRLQCILSLCSQYHNRSIIKYQYSIIYLMFWRNFLTMFLIFPFLIKPKET